MTETSDPTSSPPKKISITEEKQPAKTLWDWLQLLIIPLVLAAGAIGFSIKQSHDSLTLNANQYIQSLNIAATRYAEDQSLAQEQQVETNLQTYLDRMSDLLLNSNLHTQGQQGDNVRILATARTLTIMQDLDGSRRAVVLKFLRSGGLITRQDPMHPDIVNPVVNLNGADFSGVDLTGFVLGGADLASVTFTGAILAGADLSGAYLNQAILRGANLTEAKLDYTQLTGADLSCIAAKDPKTCTDLTHADLSGADFTGANLAGAHFKDTEVTGTKFPHGFTPPGKDVFTRKWRVFLQDTILKIDHNDGSLLPTYGQLDLNTSKLQLVSSPSGSFGISLVLLPALWSKTSCPGDYCETAPISYSVSNNAFFQDTLSISVSGTIAGLSVSVDLSFSPPQNNSISVTVNAQTSGTITLDQNVSGGAFKPVLLRAMHDSSSTWTARQAVFGSQPPSQLSAGTPSANVSTFGLVGGTSNSVTNASDITVTLNDLKAAGNDLNATVTLEVKPASGLGIDNVGMWAGVNSLPDEWSYTVVASMPS